MIMMQSNNKRQSFTIQQHSRIKRSRIKRLKRSSHNTTIFILIILFITLTTYTNNNQHYFFTTAQSSSNPQNNFCGQTYAEAHQFCHLPPAQSLPCPNGRDTECPTNLSCWTIREKCTQEPTLSPSISPTPAPLSKRSTDPSDHYYCGLGFDNLYQCQNHCPSGDSAECPSGQICYFNTPCDARLEVQPILDGGGGGASSVNLLGRPGGGGVSSVGASNFCGRTVGEATETCSRNLHCPSGLNNECPDGMFCWSHLTDCDVNLMPSGRPTISPKPTLPPTFEPTTRSPSSTDSPTNAPIKASMDHFYCGLSWVDAKNRCHMRCTEFYNNCPAGEECFNNVPCAGKMVEAPASNKPPTLPPSYAPFSGTRAPTLSPQPTQHPIIVPATPSPTHSPLPRDDMRNFFFCGNSWMDASRRCYKRCISGHHMECPGTEQCFAQADCRKLITKKPTPRPTVAPHPGTRSPTLSPAPSMVPTEPQPTESPLPPDNEPTSSPTTPWPTFLPTFAPCQGDPCPNLEHCRSKTGYCGAGPAYCKNASWEASCGVPTDPPVSLPPTSPWPSVHPSVSFEPTSPSPPTRTPSYSPSMVPSVDLTDEPTQIPSEEVVLEVEEEFAADDPRGTFFCGTDWNNAITECSIRCPSGEFTECPEGWSCYAFTPCTGVKTPSVKPTWEPTRKPVFRPTRQPYDSNNEVNESTSQQGWQQPPSLKPTYKPTGDRCRATPCEDKTKCRSKLGFCGEGIIYCNSESSWEPQCDPNYGTYNDPTHAPSTLFDLWFQQLPDTQTTAVSTVQNTVQGPVEEVAVVEQAVTEEVTQAQVNTVDYTGGLISNPQQQPQYQEQEEVKETEGEITYADIYSQKQEEEEPQVWWRVTVTSSASDLGGGLSLLISLPIFVLLWY